MKFADMFPTLVLALAGMPAQAQDQDWHAISTPYVIPQSKALTIASQLDNWTLENGDRPTTAQLARDCLSATSYIMQDGSGAGLINQSAMPGMSFWSAINGAVYVRADRNGEKVPFSEGDTAYKRRFMAGDHKAAMDKDQVPGFVRDYYAECEAIRKRFGG